jgi:ribosome-dependent ATPase
MIPAANFSGVLVPVSSLGGLARAAGLSFPPAWYQVLGVGAFTKGLGYADLRPNLAVLAAFFAAYLVLILQKQER